MDAESEAFAVALCLRAACTVLLAGSPCQLKHCSSLLPLAVGALPFRCANEAQLCQPMHMQLLWCRSKVRCFEYSVLFVLQTCGSG